jgi:MFS family permease
VDRYGQAPVLMLGVPLLSLTLTSFYWAPLSLPMFIAQCAAVGITGAASYQFVYYSIVSLWFDRRLGMALGFAGVGTSIGFLIFTPLANHLIRTYDWQTAYLVLGLVSAAVAIPNLLLYPRRPVSAPGAAAAHGARRRAQAGGDGLSAGEALRSVAFWRLGLAFFLMCVMLNGNFLHFIAIMGDRGIDSTTAAGIAGLSGFGVLTGRLGSGFLLLRFNGARVGALIFFMGAVGATILVSARDPLLITCALLMLSLALGSEGELLNFMADRTFGLKAQGTILGLLTAAYLVGTLSGPMLMSVWYDRTQDYPAGQVALVVCGALAVLLHWGVAPPPSRGPKAVPANAVA